MSWIRCVVIMLAAVAWAMGASGQPLPDGTLVGSVRDVTGSVMIGARVAVTAPSLIGGGRSTLTDQRGWWRLPSLPAGTYEVTASSDRFSANLRSGVRLPPGSTVTLDFVLSPAGVNAFTRVEAPPPLVDVTTAAVPAPVTSAMLHDLPTSRVLSDLINLVPGVAGEMAFGGSRRSNALYVDGVDTTESSEQGPWLRFGQNWVQDVHVAGLGAGAGHGGFTGVAAHAVIRSGANSASGLAEWWTTDRDWVSNNTRALSQTLQRSFASERVRAHWNVNGQIGGPIARDRVWYFGGLDHTTSDRAPAGYAGPGWREEDDTRAIAKLTASTGAGGRVEGFFQAGRHHIANYSLGPFVALEAAGQYRQPQTSWSLRAVQSLGRSLVADVRYTGYESPAIIEPQPPQTASGPPSHFDQLTNVTSGNVQSLGRDDASRHNLAATATWLLRVAAMPLELRGGLEVDRAHSSTWQAPPAGITYFDIGGAPDVAQLWEGATATGDTAHLGLFLQAQFSLGPGLTLLPGVRLDAFRGSTRAESNVFSTTPVSPRLGVAWDVGADHSTVLRASVGRYSDTAFAQAYLLTDDSDATDIVFARVVAPGVFQEISRSSGNTRSIDPDIEHSYVDQFVVGGERQFLSDYSLQVHYIHRRFDRFMLYSRQNADWQPVERRDPGPDGRPGTSDDGPLVTVYNLLNPASAMQVYNNPGGVYRRYHALQVVGRRRLSEGWHLQASYTWSRSTGTAGNGLHANAGIRTTVNGEPNGMINGADRLVHDPTNEVKILGAWLPRWFGGFTVSGIYRNMTGSAWGRTFAATGLRQGTPQILAEPRGTRRVDAINNLDMRVEKVVPVGGSRRLGVFADVFNVANQGVPDSDVATPVFTGSGPNLGLPLVWRSPRQLRLAIRVEF